MESKKNVWAARARSLLDTYLGIVLAMMDISERGKYRISIPQSGGRFIVTGKDVGDQIPHNDFHPKENQSHVYFVIVTGFKAATLHVCPGSHLFVFYEKKELQKLARVLKLETIEIPPYSIFIGHGWIQHSGAGWNGSHCLRYHLYFVPEGYSLPDGIHFAYHEILSIN